MLEGLRQVDQVIATTIDSIIGLQDGALAETATGLPLEQWLLLVARRTGPTGGCCWRPRTCADAYRGCLEAFVQGRVSWSQVRTLVLQVIELPRATDEQLDAALAEVIDRNLTADPDRLGHPIRFIDHDYGTADDDNGHGDRVVDEFLALQPRLDGTGGRFFGEAGHLRAPSQPTADPIHHGWRSTVGSACGWWPLLAQVSRGGRAN